MDCLAFSAYLLLVKWKIPVPSPKFVWSLYHKDYQTFNGKLIQDPCLPTVQFGQNGFANHSDLGDPIQKSIHASIIPGFLLWPS